MTNKLEALITSEIAEFFACFVEIHTELGGPNTVEEAQQQLTERVTRIASECEAALEQSQQQNQKDSEIKARLCNESNSLFDRLRSAEKIVSDLNSTLEREREKSRRVMSRNHQLEASQLAVKLDSDKVPDPAVHAYDGENFYIAGWNARGKADREKLRAAGITVQGDE